MIDYNKEGEHCLTIIYISLYFTKGIVYGVRMRDKQSQGDEYERRQTEEDLKDLDTAILTLIVFLAVFCHT